jgi:site-specific recombinase XerD
MTDVEQYCKVLPFFMGMNMKQFGYILCSDSELISFSAAVGDYVTLFCQGDGHTPRAKTYDIDYFKQFITAEKGSCYITDISSQDVRDYIDERLAMGEAPATVARRFFTVSHFFAQLERKYRNFSSPCHGVRAPEIEQPTPKRLSEEELSFLQVPVADFQSARYNCWLELGIVCGCRVNDLVTVTIGQVDLEKGVLRGVLRKGRAVKDLPFGPQTKEALEVYLHYRAEAVWRAVGRYDYLPERVKARYPLFLSAYGRSKKDRMRPEDWRVDPKTIYSAIRSIAEKHGFHAHPHLLRHTFAHKLLDETGDIRLVAQAMGHKDVRTTMRYSERKTELLQEIVSRPEFYKRKAT